MTNSSGRWKYRRAGRCRRSRIPTPKRSWRNSTTASPRSGTPSPSASDVEAYRFAIKFENGAEEFYLEKMNEAEDPRIKRFYKWLIDEETMHARLLRSCLNFACDPAEWFRRHR
ncbi:MAG TPA: ferritin family protein [candidate division Zixibacteria bacterium]|nr:ferritin family protein [candidate division Zixibacteria bacterium]